MQPNSYQMAVLDWIRTGRGHAMVEAVAGSGKSTTLELAARAVQGSGVFLAFNRIIAQELGDRLKGTAMVAKTIHSLGFGAVRRKYRRTKVDAGKYRRILRELKEDVTDSRLAPSERKAIREEGWPNLRRLCDLARAELVTGKEGICGVIRHHALEIHPDLEDLAADQVRRALEKGRAVAEYTVDYTDMIWLPNVLGLAVERYSWVFVDEAQDLSRAQLETVLRAVAPGGRVLGVGDSRQAIYGFAGADSQSFARMTKRLEAKTFPLSTCYRCPPNHLELARKICPQIKAVPGRPNGEILTWDREKAPELCQEGDLVICRMTAPLLKLCYELIAAGISASVRGREIGATLVKVAKDVGALGGWDFFGLNLEQWEHQQIEALRKAGGDRDTQIEAVQDKAECIRTIVAAAKPKSLDDLVAHIEALFDQDRPSVVLSTVHRAKGLQNDRVILLRPELLGRARGRSAWQDEQEQHLKYVALTRAKRSLVFVEGD